ncbi:MAG: FtsQ-type POTRA domain-containing protein [Thermodesulfovibrionales bacterium]
MRPERGAKFRSQQGRSTFLGLRMRKGYLFLIALLFVLVTGVVASIKFYSSGFKIFPVKEIVFQGNKHLSEGELKSMAGVNSGDDLLMLSAKRVAERLLKSPWIRAVSIRKDFPDRTLIHIHEALPFAILEMKGQAFLIDDRGAMLERMKGDPVPFLPVIYADPFKNRDNFMEAISLARVVKEKKIAAERSRVEIVANGKRPEDITMIVDGVVIKVGYGEYEQKLRRLFELEDEITRRAITVDYIDLRYANRVVVKPISEVIK